MARLAQYIKGKWHAPAHGHRLSMKAICPDQKKKINKNKKWERNLAQPGRDLGKSHASPTATQGLGPPEGTKLLLAPRPHTPREPVVPLSSV